MTSVPPPATGPGDPSGPAAAPQGGDAPGVRGDAPVGAPAGGEAAEVRGDDVDRVIAAWSRERPDLDTAPLAVLSRVSRLARRLDRARDLAFATHGLAVWEFDVLVALRRTGPPYRLTTGQLLAETLVTSGTMTNRIDRLEERRLVERDPDPNDRRALKVHLTSDGLRLIEQAIEVRFRSAHELAARLTDDELQELTRLLRKLLLGKPEEVVPSG